MKKHAIVSVLVAVAILSSLQYVAGGGEEGCNMTVSAPCMTSPGPSYLPCSNGNMSIIDPSDGQNIDNCTGSGYGQCYDEAQVDCTWTDTDTGCDGSVNLVQMPLPGSPPATVTPTTCYN